MTRKEIWWYKSIMAGVRRFILRVSSFSVRGFSVSITEQFCITYLVIQPDRWLPDTLFPLSTVLRFECWRLYRSLNPYQSGHPLSKSVRGPSIPHYWPNRPSSYFLYRSRSQYLSFTCISSTFLTDFIPVPSPSSDQVSILSGNLVFTGKTK